LLGREEDTAKVLVSPASPENAIKVCLLSSRVLSSLALRMVAPLIAALLAAMMVKSLPVIPSKTSLVSYQYWPRLRYRSSSYTYMLMVLRGWSWAVEVVWVLLYSEALRVELAASSRKALSVSYPCRIRFGCDDWSPCCPL